VLLFLFSILCAHPGFADKTNKNRDEKSNDDQLKFEEEPVLLSSDAEAPDSGEDDEPMIEKSMFSVVIDQLSTDIEFVVLSEEELDSLFESKDLSMSTAESESDNVPIDTSKLAEVFAEFIPEKQLPG
jgi:hypothetical protein